MGRGYEEGPVVEVQARVHLRPCKQARIMFMCIFAIEIAGL